MSEDIVTFPLAGGAGPWSSISEIIAQAIEPEWFSPSAKVIENYPDQRQQFRNWARRSAAAAIEALEAAGYSIVAASQTKQREEPSQ